MTSFSCRSRRRGVAAVFSTVLFVAMILVVAVGFFAFILENNSTLNQAAQSEQGSQLTQAGEHLSLTLMRSSSPSVPEFGIQVSNHGSVTSTITAVYVTSPTGQALSSGASGSEYLVGPTALNVTLPISIPAGSSTEAMTACQGSSCNIGIFEAALPGYSGTGDVEISVLTQDGSTFTAQYPSPISTTTTTITESGSISTVTLLGGSESTTTTVNSQTTTTSFSSTTIEGQGTPALVVSLSAACATLCSSQSVLNGGTITVEGTVTDLATSQATGVSLVISPADGIPTGTASVSPSGSCSPSSATIAAGGYTSFTCDFTASTGASGGSITFDGYAMGTVSGSTETSADATSNTLQVGYSTSVAPLAINPLSFNFTAVGQTSELSAAHISDAETYVALYVVVTNVYGEPLTLMDLTDISTQSPYVGPDPAFYLVSSVTYPASGTPSITPYDCYPGSSTTGCTTIPVGGSATLIFAACNPNTNAGSGDNYGDGSSTWIWTTDGQLGEADSGPNCGAGNPLGWAPPVGSSVTFVLFYTLGSTTSGTMYSALLPFSSMFETLPTTTSVSCTTVGAGSNAPCTGTVTCTDPYGQLSGSPTDGCTDSSSPIGDLSFTVTPTTGMAQTTTECSLVEVSNTEAECTVYFTSSVSGSYTVSATYGGDSEHGPSTGSGGLTIKRTTSTTITCSPGSPAVNTASTCTATVTDTSSGTAITPTGTVTFSASPSGDGTFSASSCTLSSGSCSVTYTPSACSAGTTITITASYGGDTNHATSSNTASVTGTTRSTSVSVTCSPVDPVLGSATTCTVTVTDTGSGTAITPTGIVTFSATGSGTFSPSSKQCTLSGSGASSSCSVSYTGTTSGAQTITGSYPGDTSHASGSGSYSIDVVRATSTTVSCTPSVLLANTGSACIATVTDTSSGTPITPTGTITFSLSTGSGSFSSTTCTLSGSGASSSCSVTFTPNTAGTSNTVTATYTPTSNHEASSGSATVLSPSVVPSSSSLRHSSNRQTDGLTGSDYAASTAYSYCLSTSSSSTSGCVTGSTGSFTSTATGTIPSGTSVTIPGGTGAGTYYAIVYSGSTIVAFAVITLT